MRKRSRDWLKVDNRVFLELSKQYDNRFVRTELLGIETDLVVQVRSYSFECFGQDGSSMYLYVNFDLEQNMITETMENPGDVPERIVD